MTIKIEIPSDNPQIALAFGKALCEIGGQPVDTVIETVGDMSITAPAGHMPVYTAPGESTIQKVDDIIESGKAVIDSHVQLAEDGAALTGPFYWIHPESDDYGIEDTREEIEALVEDVPLVQQVTKDVYDKFVQSLSEDVPPPVEKSEAVTDAAGQVESVVDHVEDVGTDTNGFPWDERIHSKNKSTNKDGTWRYCRMPKNFNGNDEAWKVYIEQIEAELKPATDDVPPPPATETDPTAVFGGDVAPPVTEDVPPPVTDTETYPEKSFPQFMTLVTSNRNNDSLAKVEHVLASMGIVGENGKPALAILNANHKDRVSEAYAKLEEIL